MKYCQFYFEKYFPAIIQTPLRQNFKYQAEKFMKALNFSFCIKLSLWPDGLRLKRSFSFEL